MSGNLARRFLVIALALGIAGYFLWRNGIKYGLDIVGGMYLAVEVSNREGTLTEQARRDATDQALEVIRNRVDQFGVAEPNIQKFGQDRIIVELPGVRDEERAKNIIRQTAFLEFYNVLPANHVVDLLPRIDREILAAMPEAARADTGKVSAAPSVTDVLFGKRDSTAKADTAAADSTKADTAAISTRKEDRPLTALLSAGNGPGEFLVETSEEKRVSQFLALPKVQQILQGGRDGVLLRWGAEAEGQGAALYRPLYVLKNRPFMTGEAIEDAQAGKDPQFNYTVVTFQLNRTGGRRFERETAANIGNRIAIVLDQQVKSAPTVQSRISQSGQIEMGSAPMTEARDLALVLRSGALPAEIQIMEQRIVGPSLGNDSIEQGKMAGLIGIALIIGIMVLYYHVAGLLACMALGVYVLIVLGGLAAFSATLTAPGIAGFLLSIGMGVDGNVLIFERIREELAAGRTQRAAVEEGFKNAMGAIIDTHLVTLITALILWSMGTGPVRGFAVTLGVGIVASFFSSVYVTKTLFLLYINRRSATRPISI
jgi:preprotein translocase subunit SecD